MSASNDEKPARSENRRRGGRTRARRFVPDESVPSPCISVCQIDDARGYCIGCFRDVDEIRDWIIMSAAEKTEVLARIAERRSGQDPKG